MAMTVMEPAQVPGAFQQAFHLMRSGRPGPVLIDLPVDVQMAEIEFDPETYQPLPVYRPAATRAQIDRALDMLAAAQRPLIVAGGGIINADASELLVEFAELVGVPVVPTLMGWGSIPDDHPLAAGLVGLQTARRYANATFLESDFVLGIGNRWAKLGREYTAASNLTTNWRRNVQARRCGRDTSRWQRQTQAPSGGRVSTRLPGRCRTGRSGRPAASSDGGRCCAEPTSTTSRSSRSAYTKRWSARSVATSDT